MIAVELSKSDILAYYCSISWMFFFFLILDSDLLSSQLPIAIIKKKKLVSSWLTTSN